MLKTKEYVKLLAPKVVVVASIGSKYSRTTFLKSFRYFGKLVADKEQWLQPELECIFPVTSNNNSLLSTFIFSKQA